MQGASRTLRVQLHKRLLDSDGQHLILYKPGGLASSLFPLRKAALQRTIVKRSRDQSSEEPKRRSCEQMVLPYCSFHVKTSFRKASRPSSWRVIPRSRASFFSTTVCVAMPAWSVPVATQTQ